MKFRWAGMLGRTNQRRESPLVNCNGGLRSEPLMARPSALRYADARPQLLLVRLVSHRPSSIAYMVKQLPSQAMFVCNFRTLPFAGGKCVKFSDTPLAFAECIIGTIDRLVRSDARGISRGNQQ